MNEMFAADVRNWFADLAIGAKATTNEFSWGDWEWQRSRTYNNAMRDGIPTVNMHYLKELAKLAGFEVCHNDFALGDYYYAVFRGEDFVMFNGVKFADYVNTLTEEERLARKKEEIEKEKEENDNE